MRNKAFNLKSGRVISSYNMLLIISDISYILKLFSNPLCNFHILLIKINEDEFILSFHS